LTAQWTKRLPIIQAQPPAALAADLVSNILDTLDDGSKWRVIDFCSGGGGPTPYIEKHVNRRRARASKQPIPFQLSDLYPNIDSWMYHAAHSDSLTFIPQPVDATNPPFAAISYTTPGDKKAAAAQGFVHNRRKVLRLFCLSFHHFDDDAARKVIQSSLETSDALVVLELQDRRIATLLAMAMEALLVLVVTIFWYPFDWVRLFLTYIVPVLPALHCFDGLVSCLRTRTYEEFLQLLGEVTKRSVPALKIGLELTALARVRYTSSSLYKIVQ
jgi:hypothetical protein